MISLSEIVDVRNPKVLKDLLESGPQLWKTCIDCFPPGLTKRNISGIVDIGDLVYEELEKEDVANSTIAIGGNKIWKREVYFWAEPSEHLQAKDELTVHSIEVFPPATNLRPDVYLKLESGKVFEKGVKVQVGEQYKVELGLVFPMKYKGSLNRVVIVEFLMEKQIGSFGTKTIRYKIGFLVLGNAVNKAASYLSDSQTKAATNLSIEASPFIPIANIVRFDANAMCLPWTDPVDLQSMLPKPTNFARCIASIEPYRFLNEDLYRNYVQAYQEHHIHDFILHNGLNHLNHVLVKDSLFSLSTTDYLRTLGLLTIFEEMQTKLDIAKFDMNFVTLRLAIESDSYFKAVVKCKLHIPGSSESRPRILIGDQIRLRPVKEDCAALHIPWFEIIAVVTNYVLASEEVTCLIPVQKFCPLEVLSKFRYDVRFSHDGTSFNIIHYLLQKNGIRSSYFLEAVFPNVFTLDKLSQYRQRRAVRDHSMEKTSFIRRQYGNFNMEQERAIQNIVEWSDMDYPKGFKPPVIPPFVIFGPPGTGKTRTVTESILRIIGEFPGKRVLACAPSDAAADVIALRLANSLAKDKLFRLNWWQRMLSSLPSPLLPYCYQAGDMFELPTVEILSKFQVVVTTCTTAGILLSELNHLEFDVVIVDEASQATEAECMIPLSLCKEGGLMVLAGDIHQLGSATKFPLYADCAPALSLQERLLKLPFYESCLPNASKLLSSLPSNLVLGVFLSKNYRSHKSLLEVPSRLFYDGKLEPYADQQQVGRLLQWEKFKAKHATSPMIFAAVNGKHEHEIDSPSFFNMAEVAKVVEICKSLVQSELVPPSQIGVIAAFRKQVLKIRTGLREVGLAAINVGSVEDFQGQEVTAVVISTVLTSWVKRFSSKGAFGFINDAKRFNVSVTRGMSLCAVVGHPDFLYMDPYWKQIIYQSLRFGCYEGELPVDLSTEDWGEDLEENALTSTIRTVMLELYPHDAIK